MNKTELNWKKNIELKTKNSVYNSAGISCINIIIITIIVIFSSMLVLINMPLQA